MARVLIAGCGYVGCRLAELLRDSGDEVVALRRNPQHVPAGVTALAADLGEPESLAVIPSKIDEVVYVAGSDGPTDDAYRRAYVAGIRNLLETLHARGQRIRRLVYVSSTGVYAQNDGSVVDETSVTEPERSTATLLLEGERAAGQGPCPVVIVRLAGIYGPGRDRIIRAVREGKATLSGHAAWTNRIHRDDCAGVLRHVLRLESPASLYLGVDTEPAVHDDVLRWIAGRVGMRLEAPPGDVPGAGIARGKRCSSARLTASGYVFSYPTFRDGYGKLLAGESSGLC